MAELGHETKRCPSDLTDEEWARIEPVLAKPSRRGRKPEVDLREALNATRCMARSAGGWRMLPVHVGPWQTIYWWFRRFVRRLLFRTIHDAALMLEREAAGREASPTGGMLEGQTVKAPFADAGYDRTKLMDKAAFLDFVVEIVRRCDKAVGFEVIPRCWVVERTFGWMIRWWHLARDYEKRLDVSEAMIHLAMGAPLLRRLAHQ